MSSHRKNTVKLFYLSPLIGSLFLMTSCGFQPAYGVKSNLAPNSPIQYGVTISASASGVASLSNNSAIDSSSYAAMARQFTHNLADMLNSPDNPAYKLEVNLVQSRTGIGVARDGTASRYNFVINSSYKLIRIADNKIVDAGYISNVTSYNNPNNRYFSTYVSEQDASKRGITELAEIYRQRLLAFKEKKHPIEPVDENPLKNENYHTPRHENPYKID